MNDSHEKPLLGEVRDAFFALGEELRAGAAARWELARLELQSDLRSSVRLVIAWLVAGVLALTALPLLISSLADALAGCCGVTRGGWLLIFAGGLLLSATVGGWLAWRRFWRQFVGLQETLEELREDWVWIREKREGGRGKEENE